MGGSLQKVIRKVWLLDVAASLSYNPRFLCFWFLVSGFCWQLRSRLLCDSFQGSLDLQLCSNSILGRRSDHPLAV